MATRPTRRRRFLTYQWEVRSIETSLEEKNYDRMVLPVEEKIIIGSLAPPNCCQLVMKELFSVISNHLKLDVIRDYPYQGLPVVQRMQNLPNKDLTSSLFQMLLILLYISPTYGSENLLKNVVSKSKRVTSILI